MKTVQHSIAFDKKASKYLKSLPYGYQKKILNILLNLFLNYCSEAGPSIHLLIKGKLIITKKEG